MSKKKIDFEESLNNLESIMESMESGELSLDKSIDKFEEGVKLYKECKKYLDKAEKKIQSLSESLKES